MPVILVSCEQYFSKLKLIKPYLQSSIQQSRVDNVSIISIGSTIARRINDEDLINNCSAKNARKIDFKSF